jgi:predicted phage terminase large subunit-like protein
MARGIKYVIRQTPPYKREDYPTVIENLRAMDPVAAHNATRTLALTDLFFLGVYVLNRKDADNDWVYERCREVQATPNGMLDLWSREHFKSTIVTNWLTIQDILNDPELTFGIFSHTRPIAKAFLRQIKLEFERNEWLKSLFPDVLWADVAERKAAGAKWSEDEGIVVKRVGNPKEATVEAWGLVDGQPTSKHYAVLLYDDVVTRESVTTPVMIANVTSAWELSTNLGSEGGLRRFAGTHYHFNDTYKAIIKKGSAIARIYPCTVDGSVHGEPVLLSRETIQKKRADMGPFNFGAQMLLNPKADDIQGFKDEWLRNYSRVSGDRMIKAILVDPASAKKTTSDYTAAFVIGLGEDENIYVLDGARDRLNLSQRWALISNLHRTWKPRAVAYERYGKDADIEHFRSEMERDEYRFQITEVGGSMPKPDRIKRLIPYFEQGRIWLPNTLWKTDYEGKRYDFTSIFIEDEFKAFPVCAHDDLLDALSRLFDLFPAGLPFPRAHAAGRGRALSDFDEFSGGYAE